MVFVMLRSRFPERSYFSRSLCLTESAVTGAAVKIKTNFYDVSMSFAKIHYIILFGKTL